MNIKSCNIIYKGNEAFIIIDVIAKHMFENSNGSINQRILGLYVHEKGGDRVLSRNNKLLICQRIQEAEIVK